MRSAANKTIYDCTFSILFMELLENILPIKHKQIIKYKDQTEENKYIMDIDRVKNNLFDTYGHLKQIPIYLRRFPLKGFYMKNDISKLTYLKYHLRNHFISVSTVYDLMLLLLNEVYKLNIESKRCNETNIFKQRPDLKEELPSQIISQYLKQIGGIKTVRNFIVHRGIFKDKDIEEVEVENFLYFMHEKNNEPIPDSIQSFLPKQFFDYKLNTIVKQKIDLVEKNNKAVEFYILNFLNSLVPEICKNLDA